jgi:SAM-dependent methyltransferase
VRFDLCAHTYDAHAGPQRAFSARVSEFIQHRAGERVVELGAGTGALTRHLCQDRCVSVLATDASAAMVRLGRRAVPTVQWDLLDAFAESIPGSELQISSGLLQWAADPVNVLRRWREALRSRGRMVHAFPCDPCLQEWRALVPASPIHWRSAVEWLEIFGQAGLKTTRRQVWVERVTFPSALDLVRAWHASGVTGEARLGTGELRRAIRKYDNLHTNAEGVYSTWAWVAIEAQLGYPLQRIFL